MRLKSLTFLGLMAMAAASVFAQGTPPLTGPVFWALPIGTVPNCTGTSGTIQLPNGGYSCEATGTFVWLAAGGVWGSTIRLAAPTSAPIGVDYTFYDQNGGAMSLDTTSTVGTANASGSDLNLALSANQPSEVGLLGLTSNKTHSTTATGSVYVVIYCPDAATCQVASPQLIYSALPTFNWSLSVPISWDGNEWTQWSAEGIDDGGNRTVSFVVYNQGATAATYTLQVYDSTGKLAGTGTTPSIAGYNSVTLQGGTYAAVLRNVITTPLPVGTFKLLVTNPTEKSFFEVLQFTGPSATTLEVAYDYAPATTTGATTNEALRPTQRTARVARYLTSPQRVNGPLGQ